MSADELALSFGRAAADYERGRPEWPDYVAAQLDRDAYERRWRIDVHWTRLAA